VRREVLSGLSRRPWFASAVVLVVTAVVVVVALSVGGDGDGDGKNAAPPGPPSPVLHSKQRSFLAKLIPSPAGGLPGARVSGVIRRLVERMPPERKAAQLMLVGFSGQDPTAPFFKTLGRYDYAGVVLERRNYTGAPGQLEAMTASVANATARRGHEPPLIVARQSGGELSSFPDLPPAALPGELAGLGDAVSEYYKTAVTLRRLGMSGVLGPPADINTHEGDTVGTRAFSDEPEQVAAFIKTAVAAFRRAKLMSAPEHFPGIGAASQDTDEGPAQVGLSVPELEKRDLVPFRAAIRAGAPAVLVSHASYAPDDFVVPGTLSKALVTNLLRGGLGFRGVAISDDMAAGAITSTQPSLGDAAVAAVQAGVDLVWISGPISDQVRIYRALLAAIKNGTLPLPRVDAAVTRTATVKRELGLRLRKRTPPVQFPNAANPGPGAVAPAAAQGPAPAAPAAPLQPQPTAPPAGR
jgi:beta-N-acetylhexosaminidase